MHEAARRMKGEGLSLRKAAARFTAMGHSVSHCGVQALFQDLAA